MLPLLKQYVMVFQSKVPMVHKLFDHQVELLHDFLSCFVKPELVINKSPLHLKHMELTGDSLLKKNDIFIGSKGKLILAQLRNDDQIRREFLDMTETAYLDCGRYLQKKLPLDNRYIYILKLYLAKTELYLITIMCLVLIIITSILQTSYHIYRLLKCMSCIDPAARGHHVTCRMLKELVTHLPPNLLSEEEKHTFDIETHRYKVTSFYIYI